MAAFFLNPRWLKEEKQFGRFGCRYTFHAIFKTEFSRNKTGSSEFCCCTGLGFLICFSKTNSKKTSSLLFSMNTLFSYRLIGVLYEMVTMHLCLGKLTSFILHSVFLVDLLECG